MKVWSGDPIGSVKTVVHPDAKRKDGVISAANDLALIKLNRPVPLDINSNGQITNNIICLPSIDFSFTKQSLAMIAGHGSLLSRTTIGTLTLKESKSKKKGHRIYHQAYFGGQRTCPVSFEIKYSLRMFFFHNLQLQGDSGSPIWMYHMGRAFLVGVHAEIPKGTPLDCSDRGWSPYLVDHVDWILITISEE